MASTKRQRHGYALATPESHSALWRAADDLDLERVGEMAYEARDTSVNLKKSPWHIRRGESMEYRDPMCHIVASSTVGDLTLHVKLKLETGWDHTVLTMVEDTTNSSLNSVFTNFQV